MSKSSGEMITLKTKHSVGVVEKCPTGIKGLDEIKGDRHTLYILPWEEMLKALR